MKIIYKGLKEQDFILRLITRDLTVGKTYEATFVPLGQPLTHIIDPDTKEPAIAPYDAIVIADNLGDLVDVAVEDIDYEVVP